MSYFGCVLAASQRSECVIRGDLISQTQGLHPTLWVVYWFQEKALISELHVPESVSTQSFLGE